MLRSKIGSLVGFVAFFSVFSNLLMLTGPLFMLQVYDRVLASRSEETLVALFILVAALFALYGIFEFSRGRVMARVGARIQSLLGADVLSETIARSAHRKRPAAGTLSDLEAIRSFSGSPVPLALFDLPWTPLFLAAIFIFHPLLGWVAVCGGAILVVVAIINQVLTARKSSAGLAMNGTAQRFARSVQDGSDIVWAQGMQDAVLGRYARIQDSAIGLSLSANDWTGSFSAFSKAFRLFLQSAILAVGAWLVLQQQMTAGAMIAGSILLGRALAPVDMVIGQWGAVQRAKSAWSGVKATIAKPSSRSPSTALPTPKSTITVKNVTVSADPGQPPVLKGVTFELNPGEAVGVIGKSGAGKSTLSRVVTGLTEPTLGEVRLDGAELQQYRPKALGENIGYLPQDVHFFDGTVAENIAHMAQEPDAKRVVAAAQKARVHDIVLQLPDGYDTPISALDLRLSGGQKQRVALARALYNEPAILILDEPNSALDADGSQALNTVISEMKSEGKSVLIMTHRPSAIQNCDKLLVLEEGRAIAFGPRDDVIKATMRNASALTQSAKDRSTA